MYIRLGSGSDRSTWNSENMGSTLLELGDPEILLRLPKDAPT